MFRMQFIILAVPLVSILAGGCSDGGSELADSGLDDAIADLSSDDMRADVSNDQSADSAIDSTLDALVDAPLGNDAAADAPIDGSVDAPADQSLLDAPTPDAQVLGDLSADMLANDAASGQFNPQIAHDPAGASVGTHTSIGIDSDGLPHIAHYDETNKDLLHSFFDGIAWTTEIVDATGSVGKGASLAVDSQDAIHIAYQDGSNAALKYATNASGTWVTQTLDAGIFVSSYLSLAVSGTNQPHIAYQELTGSNLRYIHRAGGGIWAASEIAAPGGGGVDIGEFCKIALYQDEPAIAYYRNDLPNKGVYFVRKAAGSWQPVETVDTAAASGFHISLAYDFATGTAHLAYNGGLDGLVHTKSVAGANWLRESVDNTASLIGDYTSIATGTGGKVYIAYRDETNNWLRFARFDGTSWHLTTADNTGNVGRYTSIATQNATAHIAYQDVSNTRLMYLKIPLP